MWENEMVYGLKLFFCFCWWVLCWNWIGRKWVVDVWVGQVEMYVKFVEVLEVVGGLDFQVEWVVWVIEEYGVLGC